MNQKNFDPNDLDAIAKRIQFRDETAFKELYDKTYRYIYKVSYGMLKIAEDAEEAANDIFLKIWDNAEKYDVQKGDFLSWINRLSKNLLIDIMRRRDMKRQIKFVDLNKNKSNDEYCLTVIDAKRNQPLQQVINSEVVYRIECALEKVNKYNWRIAWVLRHLEYYEICEIAHILQQTEGTVKMWIYRCRVELRDLLLKECMSDESE